MNKYLLLRDNKQTGPYTLEELITKGLKAYDLVWLEGRSAAWRYPSEFDELKPYAPQVEEQPFDRFYRRPVDQVNTAQSTGTTEQAAAQVTQQPVQQKALPVEETNVTQPVAVKPVEINTTAKHIYVTLPGGKTPVTQKEEPKKEEPKKEEKVQPVQQQQQATAQQQSKPVQKNNAAVNNTAKSSYLISEEDDELNSAILANHKSRKKEDDETNSGFLNDYEARKAAFEKKKTGTVKEEAPVQKKAEPVAVKKSDAPVASRSKKRDLKELFTIPSHFSGSFFQDNKVLVRSLVAAVLILGGVVIGLIINSGNKHPNNDAQVLETLVKEIREQQKDKSSPTSPTTSTPNNKGSQHPDEAANNDNLSNYTDQPSSNNNNIGSEPNTRHAIIKKETNTTTNKPISVPVSNTNTEEVEAQPAVIDNNKDKVNQETIEKARRNIYDLVGVEASQYKVGLLGGISDLDITISNNSLYALDQVDVEIKYFGPEKKLVKTQTLKFSHVPPGKQRTLNAPATRRGISIDYAITGINSKALGLAQAGY